MAYVIVIGIAALVAALVAAWQFAWHNIVVVTRRDKFLVYETKRRIATVWAKVAALNRRFNRRYEWIFLPHQPQGPELGLKEKLDNAVGIVKFLWHIRPWHIMKY
jgi:hypothetical protein